MLWEERLTINYSTTYQLTSHEPRRKTLFFEYFTTSLFFFQTVFLNNNTPTYEVRSFRCNEHRKPPTRKEFSVVDGTDISKINHDRMILKYNFDRGDSKMIISATTIYNNIIIIILRTKPIGQASKVLSISSKV